MEFRSWMPLCLLMSVGFSGCATLSQMAFAEPEVELTEVQVVGLGLGGDRVNDAVVQRQVGPERCPA